MTEFDRIGYAPHSRKERGKRSYLRERWTVREGIQFGEYSSVHREQLKSRAAQRGKGKQFYQRVLQRQSEERTS